MKIYYLNKARAKDPRYPNRYTQFRMVTAPVGSSIKNEPEELRICFVRKGKVAIKWPFKDIAPVVVTAGQLFMLPQHEKVQAKVLEELNLIVLAFNMLHPDAYKIANRYLFNNAIESHIPTEFTKYVLPMSSHMENCLSNIAEYIMQKENYTGNSPDFMVYAHLTLEEEIYWLFQMDYTNQQLIDFLYSGLSTELHFRSLVMSTFKQCRTVKDLMTKCGYDKLTFTKLFKKYFNELPYTWLADQTSKLILSDLQNDKLFIKDIMNKYNFSSPPHFTSFCKRNFGKSPSDIREEILKNKK